MQFYQCGNATVVFCLRQAPVKIILPEHAGISFMRKYVGIGEHLIVHDRFVANNIVVLNKCNGPTLEAIVNKLSLIHISEPTRQAEISYAVFCSKKKKQ